MTLPGFNAFHVTGRSTAVITADDVIFGTDQYNHNGICSLCDADCIRTSGCNYLPIRTEVLPERDDAGRGKRIREKYKIKKLGGRSMRKFKRTVAGLVCTAVVATAFSGCGDREDSAKPSEEKEQKQQAESKDLPVPEWQSEMNWEK